MNKPLYDLNQYIGANQAKAIWSGENYFQIVIELIDSAQYSIVWALYIFREDDKTRKVIDQLIAASSRGLQVVVILDAVGSNELDQKTTGKLKNAGAQIYFFNPLRLGPFKSNFRRMHGKVLVADGRKALVAGMNLSREYLISIEEEGWLDLGLLVQGPIVLDLNMALGKLLKGHFKWVGQIKVDQQNSCQDVAALHQDVRSKIVVNDPLKGRFAVRKSYQRGLKGAKQKAWILNGYFLPSAWAYRGLIAAAKRGVKIHLVLTEHSDRPFVVRAQKYLIDRLLVWGVQIYFWKPSVLHAKCMVIDGNWATIGSYNLDFISNNTNMEININSISESLALSIEQAIEQDIIPQCQYLSLFEKQFEKIGATEKILRFMCFVFVALIGWAYPNLANKRERDD